jgi:hypothetical protein
LTIHLRHSIVSVIIIRIQKPWTILLPEIQKPKLHG